jgi:hypothetical protein
MLASTSSPYRYALGGLLGMAAAMGIGRFVYTPILPGMMDELGLSAADAGLIASANYLGYLIGAVLGAGGWAHGRERLIMLTAIAASAVLCVLMGLTDSFAAFLLIRFAAGLASAFMLVFLVTIVFSHLAVAGRSDLQAMHFSGVGVGIAVSALMIGALVLAGQPWQAGWLWSGAISAAAFFAVMALVRDGPALTGEPRREPPLPKTPAVRRIIWSYGLFGFGYIVTATFLVAIVRACGRPFRAAGQFPLGVACPPARPSGGGRRGLRRRGRRRHGLRLDRRLCRPDHRRHPARRHLRRHHLARPADGPGDGGRLAAPRPGADDGGLRHWPDHRPAGRRLARQRDRQLLRRVSHRRALPRGVGLARLGFGAALRRPLSDGS